MLTLLEVVRLVKGEWGPALVPMGWDGPEVIDSGNSYVEVFFKKRGMAIVCAYEQGAWYLKVMLLCGELLPRGGDLSGRSSAIGQVVRDRGGSIQRFSGRRRATEEERMRWCLRKEIEALGQWAPDVMAGYGGVVFPDRWSSDP